MHSTTTQNETPQKTEGPALKPEHVEHLRTSGLTDETIRLSLARTVGTDEVNAFLGWTSRNYSFGDGILFPSFKPDGSVNGLGQVRLDYPRPNQQGKCVKYETPRGKVNRPCFGPRYVENNTSGNPTVITEGVKKLLALDQIGYPAIGLLGVWNGFEARLKNQSGVKYGSQKLHAELVDIAKSGRDIIIVFDSDAADNAQVRLAEYRLADALTKAGASVRIVRLPQVGDGKTGVDDYLVRYGDDGPAKLAELIDLALPAAKPEKPTPIQIAQDLLDDQFSIDGHPALVFWSDNYFYWSGSSYRRIDTGELVPRIQRWMDEHGYKASVSFASEVAKSLQALTVQPFSETPPFYLTGCSPDSRFPALETLVARNMRLSLPSLETGEPVCADPHPNLFTLNGLDYAIDLDAPQPTQFCDFLQSLWPNDPESIATLLEFLGYLLVPDTSHQKILLVVGPKRSGKGTIARVIRGLVGEGNCVSPTLSSLATNFGLAPLVGKTVAIISDARLSGRTDHSVVTERLLSISGEDALTIDRKNQSHVTTQLKTRFVIFTNELPRMGDSSGALAGRMVILRLRHSFYGNEDMRLTEKLLAERSGILLMALEGWKRLRERGRFVQPESGAELVEQMEEITSPVGAFVADCCELAPDAEVPVQTLFDAWRSWCEASGKTWTGDAATFGRDLRAALPDLDVTKRRQDGGRVRKYVGIRLLDA